MTASCILSIPQALTRSRAESSLTRVGREVMAFVLTRAVNSSVWGRFTSKVLRVPLLIKEVVFGLALALSIPLADVTSETFIR